MVFDIRYQGFNDDVDVKHGAHNDMYTGTCLLLLTPGKKQFPYLQRYTATFKKRKKNSKRD